MIYKTVLRQTHAKISGLSDKEINMAVDSTIHADEFTFKDAIKKMATKADVREATMNMATKSDIAETKLEIAELKVEIAKLEARTEKTYRGIVIWMVGVGMAATGIVVTGVGLMIKFL